MSNYQYKVNGVDYNVEIQDIENNIAHVSVNGKVFEIEMPETMKAPVAVKKEVKPVEQKPAAAAPKPANEPKPAAKPSGKGTKVVAPLPGTITDVKVAVGDTVKTGDSDEEAEQHRGRGRRNKHRDSRGQGRHRDGRYTSRNHRLIQTIALSIKL